MKVFYSISILILIVILFSCDKNKNILGPYISSYFKILYNSDSDIFIMDSNGNHKKNLTFDMNKSDFVSNGLQDVTSDGQNILFNQSSTDTVNWENVYTTYIMDINGENKKIISDTSLVLGHSKFSLDGLYIASSVSINVNDIYLLNSDGSDIRNLTNDSDREWFPQFSQDGSKIIYISSKDNKCDIYSINIDGSSKTNLTHDGAVITRGYNLSYDRSKIVYVSNKDGQSNIYTMNIDGTNQIKITNSFGNANPVFSYDNSKIAYISWSISGYDIKIIDNDGKNERKIAYTIRPRNDYWRPIALFSPDDEYIIFTSFNDVNSEIYITDIYGKNMKNLTTNPNYDDLGIVLAIK